MKRFGPKNSYSGKTEKLQSLAKYGDKPTKAMKSWLNTRELGMRKAKRSKP